VRDPLLPVWRRQVISLRNCIPQGIREESRDRHTGPSRSLRQLPIGSTGKLGIARLCVTRGGVGSAESSKTAGGNPRSWRWRFRGVLTGSNWCFFPVAALAPVPSPRRLGGGFSFQLGSGWRVHGTFCCLLDLAGDRHGRFQRFWILFEWQSWLRRRNRSGVKANSSDGEPRFQRNLTRRSAKRTALPVL